MKRSNTVSSTYRPTGRLRGLLFALTLLLAPLLGLLSATPALAAPSCTTSGATVTCTFSYTGAPETWTVPAGVTSATFDLYGAKGGGPNPGGGGRVLATLTVAPGDIYQIRVGGQRGYNGGGAAGSVSSSVGNGGGASDVRSGAFGLDDRLLVAGGGGGAAYDSRSGANGGNAGYPNGEAGRSLFAGGGGGGTQTRGGAGGAPGGGAGSQGQGGAGGVNTNGGGGGGGGYYGGGGGGGNSDDHGGGGGGGSSYATPAATGVSYETHRRTGDGLVIISYSLPSDTAAPTASPSQAPAANTDGWNNTDVIVSWNWSDEAGGSGIDSATCVTSYTLRGEGIITLSDTCRDLAGNQGSASYTVKLDTTAPTISAAASSSPNASGWYNGDVTVAFSCADILSGVPNCPANQTLSGEGSAISSTAQTATDLAGNSSAPSNVVTVQIDRTAPLVSVTGVTNGASYTLGSVPTAGCSTNDPLSGVATQAAVSLSGGNPDGTGSFTVTCSGASDLAGNTASVSVSYEVLGATFPATAVLDNFDRANGRVGNDWAGLTGTSFYKIAANQLDVQGGGPLVWKTSFGASQEAFVRLATIDATSRSQGVLLKVQDSSRTEAGAIAVVYDARARAVRVSTLRLGQNGAWTLYPAQAATFANGDVLGARAKTDGTIEIYQNGMKIATVILNAADGAFFNARSGKIGVWTAIAPRALLDDFGGGNVAP
jgi:hypothetical protein